MTGVDGFDAVADEYDAARPSYPDAVFDACSVRWKVSSCSMSVRAPGSPRGR